MFQVGDVGQLDALLGESPDVVVHGFIRLLPTAPKVLGVTGVHVCALEVVPEDPNQVVPVIDLCRRKVFDLGSGDVG